MVTADSFTTARPTMLPLTSLRAFAAIAVVGYHMDKLAAEHWPVLPAHAVSLFFVLSGLVLQRTYGGDLRGLRPLAFVARRLARIWPLHAFLAIGLVLMLPSWTGAADHFLRALSLTQAWSSDDQEAAFADQKKVLPAGLPHRRRGRHMAVAGWRMAVRACRMAVSAIA